MPGIIILLIFNEQLRLVFGATPLQDELARSAKMIEDTVYGFPSRGLREESAQGARGATCSRFSRPASTNRSMER